MSNFYSDFLKEIFKDEKDQEVKDSIADISKLISLLDESDHDVIESYILSLM